jgi:hypothetical protein
VWLKEYWMQKAYWITQIYTGTNSYIIHIACKRHIGLHKFTQVQIPTQYTVQSKWQYIFKRIIKEE